MKSNEDKQKPFWSGYALGAFSAGIAAYALGTRSGRKKLRSIIEYIDNHEKPSELIESLTDIMPDLISSISKDEKTDINSVISKMKNKSTEGHKSKKFTTS